MKKHLLLFTFLFSLQLHSQTTEISDDLSVTSTNGYELKLMLGMSSYEGDLHCFDDEELGMFTNSKVAFGLGVSKNLNKNFGLGISYRNTKLSGDDNKFSSSSGHNRRGFVFSNSIHELTLRADYTILGHRDMTVQPYIFAGLGFAFGGADVDFNPTGIDNPASDALIMQDMTDIKKSSFALPIGIGFKGALSNRLTIGLEAGLRFFTNDYLDGVSVSANSDVTDYYGIGGILLSYKL